MKIFESFSEVFHIFPHLVENLVRKNIQILLVEIFFQNFLDLEVKLLIKFSLKHMIFTLT